MNARKSWKPIGTCHSSNPCMLSELSFLTATTIPQPLFVGFRVFSSTQPLYTLPKPPSPRKLSGLKFFVALFSSAKVKIRRLAASRIRPLGSISSALWLEMEYCPLLLQTLENLESLFVVFVVVLPLLVVDLKVPDPGGRKEAEEDELSEGQPSGIPSMERSLKAPAKKKTTRGPFSLLRQGKNLHGSESSEETKKSLALSLSISLNSIRERHEPETIESQRRTRKVERSTERRRIKEKARIEIISL